MAENILITEGLDDLTDEKFIVGHIDHLHQAA
jgi:hypothetical protein